MKNLGEEIEPLDVSGFEPPKTVGEFGKNF